MKKANPKNVSEIISSSLKQNPDKLALVDLINQSEKYTYRQLNQGVNSLARVLHSLGIRKGTHCSIFSFNCPKWIIADLAIQKIMGVCVPIYWKLSVKKVEHLLKTTKPKVIFVGDHYLYKIIQKCDSRYLPKHIIMFNGDSLMLNKQVKVYSWKKFMSLPKKNVTIVSRNNALSRIVFTSGSTGLPKGVLLSHENILSNLEELKKVYNPTSKDSIVSYLPLNHMFGLVGEVYLPLYCGGVVYFAHNPQQAFHYLKKIKPTHLMTVPFVLEKLYKGVIKKVSLFGIDEQILNLTSRKPPWFTLNVIKFLGKMVSHRLGGNLKYIVSAGAHLSKEVELFFHYAGLPLYTAYGMTEASPVIACNVPGHHKLFSVGVPLDKIKISKKGVVAVKGKNITSGYFKDKIHTSKALHNGWLSTGDLGHVDKFGHLYILERSDDIIVLSKGENINPLLIEEKVEEEIAEVTKSIIYGNHKPSLVSLLFVSGKINSKVEEKIKDKIHLINTYLPHYERIINFKILSEKYVFTPGAMKISRKKLINQFKGELDKLY
jgi:long-chain acyl-CoA synthetase